MKKVSLIFLILVLLATACTNNKEQDTNVNTDSVVGNISENAEFRNEPNERLSDESNGKPNEESIEELSTNTETEIDRTEYFTGEIIIDGNYEFMPESYGSVSFVPDKESREIIIKKYYYEDINFLGSESYGLIYDDMSVVENLPLELGIYKVKVSIDVKSIYDSNQFFIKDIKLTDEIGTILYDGKTYDTNVLDFNFKVKDIVCGLIISSVIRTDNGGILIIFAGDIKSEGYYTINYSEFEGGKIGTICLDEEYRNDFPILEGEKNVIWFRKTNELFDLLENNAPFGRGEFKTSNYSISYMIEANHYETLEEVISLDEGYKNMFKLNKGEEVYMQGINKDYAVVSLDTLDENMITKSQEYYYINKKNPKKIFLFTTDKYYYCVKVTANENEFILATDGLNWTGMYDEPHSIICIITEQGAVTVKIEDLSIGKDEINEDGKSLNIVGCIEDIKIINNQVEILIKSVNKDELVSVIIIDNNRTGVPIKIGDKVLVSCCYTKNKEFLYAFGADISVRK